MEIFTGPPNWFCGVLAPYILNGYRKRGPRPPYPAMPIALADILEKCFKDPEKRWQSMDELVVQLKKVYEDVIGRTYNRPNLKPVFRVAKRVKYDRSSIEIGSWGDPVEWLKKAYSALGRDPTEVHNILPEWHGSWKARALADLEIFHEAKNLFTELVSSGRLDLEEDLAAIHYHMANILFNIEDFNEAVANYRCCLCIEENLYHEDHNKTRSINLASVYVQMANTYQYMRMHEMALANYKKALDQWESIQYEYQHKAQFDQAKILMNTATALTSLKSFEEAVATLDKAIEKLENLFKSEKDDEISLILAVAYNNKAYTLNQMDRFKEAVPLTQKSIRIIEKKMENESSELLGISLFKYLMQNGINLKNLEDFDNALAMYERAYKVLNPLIHEQGRSDLLPSLCMLHCNKAQILYVTGNYSDSLSLMNKALSMVNRLIHEKGRRDLIQLKLSIQSSKIRVLKSTGNYDAGLKLIEITKNGFQALCNERQENFWKDDMDRLQAEREEIKQLMTRED